MTPAKLRTICDSLNPGGQSRLARMLKWDSSMIRRRLSGETKITYADELAIAKALEATKITAGDVALIEAGRKKPGKRKSK